GGTGALELDRLADDLEHAELRFDLGGDARRAHPEARIPFDGAVVKWFVNSAESMIPTCQALDQVGPSRPTGRTQVHLVVLRPSPTGRALSDDLDLQPDRCCDLAQRVP